MNNMFRNLALWVIIGLLLIALFQLFQSPTNRTAAQEIPFSQFLSEVESDNVRSVVITDQNITGQYARSGGGTFQTYACRSPRSRPARTSRCSTC